MKYIFLIFIITMELFGAVVKSPVINVSEDETEVTVKMDKIDAGVSGFIVHNITEQHTIILKSAVVKSYDKESKIATLTLGEYDVLTSNALPSGKWHVKAGDMAVLAYGYTRGLLIAPTEDIYYKITKQPTIQWVHPDIFATILSFNGHPTPLRSDFTQMSVNTSVGLVYLFLNQKVYTLDSKSFNILAITDAKLEQTKDKVNLPFYTRVPEIDANWWGEGSDELDDYEPYYYELIIKANPKNMELYNIVKNGDEKFRDLLEEFDIKE